MLISNGYLFIKEKDQTEFFRVPQTSRECIIAKAVSYLMGFPFNSEICQMIYLALVHILLLILFSTNKQVCSYYLTLFEILPITLPVLTVL